MVPLWIVFLPILLTLAVVMYIIHTLLTEFVIDPWFAKRMFPELERDEALEKLHEVRQRALDA